MHLDLNCVLTLDYLPAYPRNKCKKLIAIWKGLFNCITFQVQDSDNQSETSDIAGELGFVTSLVPVFIIVRHVLGMATKPEPKNSPRLALKVVAVSREMGKIWILKFF